VVASVRDFPDAPDRRAPAPGRSSEPNKTFAELLTRAQHANEILRVHFLAAKVSPARAETLRQWSYRILRNGISQAIAATTRRGRYLLPADAADDPFNFNSEMFDAPRTVPALPVPSDFRTSSIHQSRTFCTRGRSQRSTTGLLARRPTSWRTPQTRPPGAALTGPS
jgi:hypothetical protein